MAEIQNFSRKRPDSSAGFIGSLISKAYSNFLGNTYLPFSFKKVPSLYLIINAVLNFKTVLSTKFPRVCILKYKSVSGLCYAPFVYVLALIWLCWKEFLFSSLSHFTDNPFTPATHLPSYSKLSWYFYTFILLKDLDSQSVKAPAFLLDFHLYLRKDWWQFPRSCPKTFSFI